MARQPPSISRRRQAARRVIADFIQSEKRRRATSAGGSCGVGALRPRRERHREGRCRFATSALQTPRSRLRVTWICLRTRSQLRSTRNSHKLPDSNGLVVQCEMGPFQNESVTPGLTFTDHKPITTKPWVCFETLRFHSESRSWMFAKALPGLTAVISRIAPGACRAVGPGSDEASQSSKHVMRAQASVGIEAARGRVNIYTTRDRDSTRELSIEGGHCGDDPDSDREQPH